MELNLNYKSIIILDTELYRKGIPHEKIRLDDGWKIAYPNQKGCIFDVIETKYSYGHTNDLMEAYGNGIDDVEVVDIKTALLHFERVHKQYCGMQDNKKYFPPMKERILHFFRDIDDKYINGYRELSGGLDALEKEVRNNTIDEFSERLKNHLNEFDFWKYGISDGTNYDARNYDHMIDEIAEKMKGRAE